MPHIGPSATQASAPPAPPSNTHCRLGISGVPFFIISSAEDSSAEGHALSGAQPVGAFVKTVKQVLSEQQQRQQQ